MINSKQNETELDVRLELEVQRFKNELVLPDKEVFGRCAFHHQ